MAKASWGGKVIGGKAGATVVVEGHQYFPPESVNKGIPQAPAITPRSARGKGTAHYFPCRCRRHAER